MGEFIVEDVHWKKGEQGVQKFIIFESDGVTRRNGTGLTYSFAFWKDGAATIKGSGNLNATSAAQGEHDYVLQSTDTDTVYEFLGELIEDPAGTKLRSETFKVIVEKSSDLT